MVMGSSATSTIPCCGSGSGPRCIPTHMARRRVPGMALKGRHSGNSSSRQHLEANWRACLSHLRRRRWSPTSGRWLIEDASVLAAVSPPPVHKKGEGESRQKGSAENRADDNARNLASRKTATAGRIIVRRWSRGRRYCRERDW
jgi:hypothetical protein